MKRLISLCLASAVVCISSLAVAQSYPDRTITVVVPYPPAGTIDRLARQFADHLSKAWSQPVVVENRAGGNGVVGAEQVRNAAPDGYTLLVGGGSTHTVGPATDAEIKYDPIKDFTPVGYFGETPMVITAGNTVTSPDLPSLVAEAKANPNSISYGSVGNSTFLAATMLENASSAKFRRVNYKQFGPALIDITNGDVNLGVSSLSIVIGNIQQNQLRPIVVTSRERSPLLPNVPTVAETYPGFEVGIWFGLYGPAGMPEDIAKKLNDELATFQQIAGNKEKWAKEGFAFGAQSLADFAAFTAADLDKWTKLAAQVGLGKGQ